MTNREPDEVRLTRALVAAEQALRDGDTDELVHHHDRALRHQLAGLLGVRLATDEEIDDADEGFWTSCEPCGGELVYLQGVGETVCRACHWDRRCLDEACGDVCEVYPSLEVPARQQPELALTHDLTEEP